MRVCCSIVLICIITMQIYAQNKFHELYSDCGISCQSATNYGKYLFLIADRYASITLYDLDKKEKVYTLKMEQRLTKNHQEVVYHCNQCCFGKEKYDEKDEFPLLYVSQRNEMDSVGAFLDVLRIIPYRNTKKSINSIMVDFVQKIYFPVMTDSNSMGNPNAVIDVKKGYIYTYSRNNNKKAPNVTQATFSKFKLPRLRKDGNVCSVVNLTNEDILEAFPCDFSMVNAQGGFYKKNKLIFVQGYPSDNPQYNYIYYREIDLKKKKQVKFVDMLNEGFNVEPEGCWYYGRHVMVADNKGKLYRLIGDKYKVK